MTDHIHNYPISSCSCFECVSKKIPVPTGVPTNMSVRGCNFSEYDCNTNSVFKVNKVPGKQTGITILNPGVVGENKFDPTFQAINATYCPGSSCDGTTYLNSDPRLYNQGGSWLQLDRPPLISGTDLSTLTTDKSLDGYGQNYKSYADINAGQYMYYIDKSTEDAFYEPNFSSKATSVGSLYKDPMGTIKPQYDRVPDNQYNHISNGSFDDNEYSLTFLRDTQHHREDIMALQMRRRNQERYVPRWTNIDN
jgi:hypothetical protein